MKKEIPLTCSDVFLPHLCMCPLINLAQQPIKMYTKVTLYIQVYIYIPVCIYIYIYIYVCIYIYVLYIYIYILRAIQQFFSPAAPCSFVYLTENK